MNTEEKLLRISLIDAGFTEEQVEIAIKCILDDDED